MTISVVLIVIATTVYPGGSLYDEQSTGFDWSKNFFSNLFEAKAINGKENTSRLWALFGIAFHSFAYGLFFIHMSRKVSVRHSAIVLRSIGIANILFTVLIATPLHDLMVVLSSTLFLLGLFYITVSILKTRLTLFKIACTVCLLVFYFTLYLYGSGDRGLLAIFQKVSFIGSMTLILGLEYLTKQEDFEEIKAGR